MKKSEQEKKNYLEIPQSSVVKEYDFGAIKVTRCMNHIIFSTKGGFKTILTPTCTIAYNELLMMLDNYDKKDELNKEEQETLDSLRDIYFSVFMIPILALADLNYCIDETKRYTKYINELYEKSLNTPLSEENEEEIREFFNKEKANEQVKDVLYGKENESDGQNKQ